MAQLMERRSRPGRSGRAASRRHRGNLQSQHQKRRLRLGPHNRAGHAAQSANPAASETAHHESEQAPHETPVSMAIFTDRRYRICCTEGMLAAHDDIAVWRDRKVKWTELWISYLP